MFCLTKQLLASRKNLILLLAGVCLFAGSQVDAQYNVQIVPGSTLTNMTAGPVFNPTAPDAEVGVDLIVSALASGNVSINTNTGGSQQGNITFTTSLFPNGPGNTLTLNASGSITMESIERSASFEAFALSLNADGGFIEGAGKSIVTGGGTVTINSFSTFSIGTISTSSSSSGGDITMILGQDLIVDDNGSISASGGGAGAGTIDISAGGQIETATGGTCFLSADDQNGGLIALTADAILAPLDLRVVGGSGGGGDVIISTFSSSPTTTISAIDISGSFAGGSLDIDVAGPLVIGSDVDMSSSSASSSAFIIRSGGDVTMSGINTSSNDQDGGPITIISTGLVSVGNVNSDGLVNAGAINLDGFTGINAGTITASSNNFGNGANVSLKATDGPVSFTSINTESSSADGGSVQIDALGTVLGFGSFTASNGESTSISTIGASLNGGISITHNVDNAGDFEVGQNTGPLNGVFADIAANASVASDNYLNATIVGGNYVSGDSRISILTPITGGELLVNGDFETGDGTGWTGSGLNVIDGGSGFVNFVDVTVAGAPSDVNISQVLTINENENYTLQFEAFSNIDRTMVVGIGQNEAPFIAETSIVNLSTFNQQFTIPLTAIGFGGVNSRVLFDMGAELGEVTIDNVSLVQGVLSTDASLASIEIDGVPLNGFDAGTFDYLSTFANGTIIVPTITATSTDPNASVFINQATELPGVGLISVTAEDGITVQFYTVFFGEEASLPIDFENSSYPSLAFGGANFLVAQDPENTSNQVGRIINSGTEVEGVSFFLKDPVEMSNGSLFSIRFYTFTELIPLTFKLENDEVDFIEETLQAPSIGWNTLIFDFGNATGSYEQLTLFVDLNGFSIGDFFVDNIQQFEPVSTNPADSVALVSLYNATNNSGWDNRSGWEFIDGIGSPINVQQWFGVTVNAAGRVTKLDLSENSLNGSIPDEIGNLTELTHLIFGLEGKSGSDFSESTLPASIGNLSKLEVLGLADCQLTGDLPSEISTLSSLRRIDLAFNQFTSIPTTIDNLTNLTYVGFGFNQFTSIPSSLYSLSIVDTLIISGNQLTGVIPAEIGNMTSLQFLNIGGNSFESTLPPSFGNLVNLEELRIWSMPGITGTIPSEWSALTQMRNFEIVDLSLTGELPVYPAVETLNARGNQFTNISPDITSSVNLQFFEIKGSALTSIPVLTGIPQLIYIDISENRLTNGGLDVNKSFSGTLIDDNQKGTYPVGVTGTIATGNTVTITITNDDSPLNLFQWIKDGEVLPGETSSSFTIPSLDGSTNGTYYCLVYLDGQDISTAINSEAVVVDLSRSDFRYANTVLNVSSAADVVDYQSIEILGLPNAFGINARPENGWAPAREDTAPSIELTFENASPINTLWFHGEAAFSINSVEAWNPGTNEYEVIASGIASEIPLGEELEVNFPTTSFPVDRIRIIGFTNFYEFLQDGTINIRSLDAVAIGENGLQITNPTNLVGSIVNSTIINVSWNHPNVTDETVYRLERSTDNMSFTEISNAGGIVGFTRFRDATVPDVDQVYYRVRAELSGQISEFSEVLVVERCGQDLVIPEGSYTASAIESSPIGGNSENVNASIVSNNDGTYTISNVFASYLSGLGGSTTATGTLSEGCGGILNIEVPDLAVGCGDNSVVVTSVTYTSASETLEYIFDFTSCGISVTVTFVKDATEPVQPAPGNLNVNVANANSTFLRWTDNSNFESSWVIERSTDGVNYNEIADVLPNPQRERSTDTELETYIDNTVTPGTQYFYQVRARNGSGDSDPSNSAVVTVAAPPFTQILVGDVVEDAPSQSYSGTWADLDGDADLDLYVTNWFQGADPALVTMENYLYLNQGNGSFVKSTSSPLVDGEYVSRGAFVGDFDNDGNLDLFVNGQGSSAFVDDANSILFFGDGAGGYVSQTDFQAEAYNAAVADLNNDGLLDIIAPTASEVYINLGNRQFDTQPFTDYVPNFLGASWANLTPDLNSDGLPDLILNGDSRVDIFLNNNGVPLTNTYGNDQLGLARGAVFGDFDNDLDLDVIISSRAFGQTGVVTSSIFLQNDGNGAFVEVQADQFLDQVPITQRGLTVLDYNNDGNEDLFWLVDDGQPIIYEGAGDGTFTTLTESLENLPTINAFSHPSVGDFNDDGRQDLFISNFDATGAVGLFVNSQGGNNFLKIDLEGSNSNRFGIGSQIEVKSGGQWRMKQVTSTNGVWSSNEITAHFGLGAASQADSVVVRWTSGKTTVLKDIGANQRILVPETVQPPVVTINPLVTNQPSPELAGTVDIPEATIEVELPQGIYPATNNQDGTWTLPAGSIVPGLKTTTYDVIVRGLLQDTVGIDDTIDELRVDVTLPVVDIDFLGTSVSSPELTGFIDDSTATLSLEIDGSTYENELVRDGNSWSLPAGVISPGLTDGTYDVIASSIDSLGNVGSDATQNELVITTEIIALSPSRITPFSFRANWSEGTDAQSYRLDVAEDENFSSFVEGFEDLTVAETNTTVAGLDFDTDYFYRVRFENTANEISGNSETISLRTTISPETVADFNELAEIYNQTGGENWTNSGGWTTEPRLQNWDFISLENGRVTSIDLSNNNVTGFFPLKDSLTEVSSINLAENEIEGYGDLSKLSSLITLAVDNNQLLFDDIELLFGKIPTFTYQNQAGIKFVQDEDRQIEVNQGNDTTLTISTPGSANVYTYFREDLNDPDGVPVQVQNGQEYGVNDNVLDILSIDFGNMGIMSGQVTSTIVDDLVIPVDTVGVYATAEVGITVIDPNGTTILADQVNGALLFTSRQGTAGFDTLEFVENRASQFSFDKVILGNYLIAVDSDPDKYVPSYYSNTFLWEEADTIRFRKDSTFEITIVGDPEPLTADDGEGTLRVLVEEDFGEETDAGRIDARRRAARRKCGLRKRRTGGRIDQDEGIFDLIAYGETDDQGQFEFGFLPQGQYRFFVEYPGIPLDESSFVEFEVGEAGISDTDFKLEAFATADGVQVEIQAVLGVILEYFKNLQIYPNPSSEFLKIKYRHLRSGTIRAQMTDLAGLELWSRTVPQGYDGSLQIDVSSLAEGMYILRFFDEKAASSNVVTYRVLVGR